MNRVIHVGLDVHKQSLDVGALMNHRDIVLEKHLKHHYPLIEKELVRLADTYRGTPIACCYEAGPTGFGLARKLNRLDGIRCTVIAPGSIPKQSGDRVKTDRRDAMKLAHMFALGVLSEVAIPETEDEMVKELLRYRNGQKEKQKRAKQQLKSFLLRSDQVSPVPESWTKQYRSWIQRIDFDSPHAAQVRDGYLNEIAVLERDLRSLTAQLEAIACSERYARDMEKLRLLRGIGLITGLSLLTEVGDFTRFPSAPSFMAWLGLVPSESSSGGRIQKGKLTKTGNGNLRKLLTEASWHYLYRGNHKSPQMQPGSALR